MADKIIFRLVFLTLFLAQSCDAVLQPNAPLDLIPREVLFDLEVRKEQIKISPDASTVYYVKGAYQPVPDNRIYYRSIDDLEKEFYFEFSDAVADYEILRQGELLVRTVSPQGQSVKIFNLNNRFSTALFSERFRRIKWLAFSENNKEAAFIAMPLNGSPILFRYNFNVNKIDTLSNVAQGHYPLYFDKKLNVVAGEKIDRTSGDKSLDVYKNGQWQSIRTYQWSAERFLRPGLKSIVGVLSDGSELYFTDNTNADKTVLKAFDLKAETTTTLVEEQHSDLMVNSFIVTKSGSPVAIANHYSKREWHVIDSVFIEDFEFLQSKIKDFNILDISSNLTNWLVEEVNGGANISYLYNRNKQKLKKLFTNHETLEEYPKVNRFYDQVSSFDGVKLPIQYYVSEKFDRDKDGLPDEKIPAIIYVHGGPWQGWMEDFWLISRHLQLLADRGYLVVYAQYRGALTYGKAFLDAGNEQWGSGMVKDKVAIAEWLAAEKNVIPKKIGIFGWSYGGYAALAGAAFSPDTYACAISLYGPTYLDAPKNENAFGYAPNSLIRIADLTTEEGRKLAHRHSPLYAADRIEIPVLMSTGAKDDRVPQMQMDKMADALHDKQKDVIYFVYPQEGHDYAAKASWISFWSIAEQFLSNHLGGRAEPNEKKDFSILEMKYPPKFD